MQALGVYTRFGIDIGNSAQYGDIICPTTGMLINDKSWDHLQQLLGVPFAYKKEVVVFIVRFHSLAEACRLLLLPLAH